MSQRPILSVPSAVRGSLRRIGRLADAQDMRAYAVGGCVRDLLLGRSSTEIDVAVEGDAIALARAVAQETGGVLTVHEQFGTATVVLQGRGVTRVDFAMCRKECYAASGAYPQVTPGTLAEDLIRRDFTINTMALQVQGDAFGTLVDPYSGAKDLRARRLRVLHARSFVDDPSRILRGIRFAARFDCVFEPSTRRWLIDALRGGGLERLNRGRWRKELGLMLEEPDPLACFRLLGRLLTLAGRRST